MRLRSAMILAAGLALSGCAGGLDGTAVFGGGDPYAAQPYDYAYGGPYYAPPPYGYQPGFVAPYGYQSTYVAPFAYQQPGWGGRDWQHEHDHDHDHGAYHGGDWNHGQPHGWAGQPGGHPVNLTPPAPRPAPPPAHAPDARTQQQQLENALGFYKPNR
jgi:hypothetical protein